MNFIDRCIYGYIVGWIEQGKTFYMTDKQMSKILKIPVSTISKHLKRLEDRGCLQRHTSPLAYGGKSRTIIPLRHLQKPNTNVPKDELHDPNMDIPIKDIRVVDKNTINKSSDKELTPELIQEMKTTYKDKDIDKAVKSFLNHDSSKYLTKDNIEEKFRTWCENEHTDTKKIIEKFRLDGGGVNYVGYCGECGVSAFYKEEDLMGESICCQNKLLPNKPNGIVGTGQWT